MRNRRPGISTEAQAFVDSLKSETLARTDYIQQYRQNCRFAYAPTVTRALEKYAVKTDDIEINGVPCLQFSAADWAAD